MYLYFVLVRLVSLVSLVSLAGNKIEWFSIPTARYTR